VSDVRWRWQAADGLDEAYGKNLNKERVRQEIAAKVPVCARACVFSLFAFVALTKEQTSGVADIKT